MKYDECLQVLSPARLNKYAQASGYEKAKTLRLYQYNIKLSQRFYGVIGMFEIMLRNAINAHYKQYFNDDNWIINQARPNGLLEQEASEIVRIQRTYTNMGVYNNDKMVASFTFGFWTYLGSVVILGGLSLVNSLHAYTFASLKRKKLISTTPLNDALNALILALNASAAAFVLLFTKKFKILS